MAVVLQATEINLIFCHFSDVITRKLRALKGP